VNARRTKVLDLVGLQLVVDVAPACAVLSTEMVARRTSPEHQGKPKVSMPAQR
jgi:hypothetical protein